MAAIPHMLSVYQKPAQGTSFLAQYRTIGYKHKLSSFGGCDTASCQIICTRAEAERIYADFVGNAVRVYADDPVTPIFDGFVNRVTFEVGNVVFTRSLDNMMNRACVTYYNASSAATAKTEQTAVANNTTSQALYMIKEGNYDGGVHYNNADTSHKTAVRSTALNLYAYPQVSAASRAGGGVLLTVELKGWYHCWDWEIYRNTGTTLRQADAMIRVLLIRTDLNAPSNAPYIYKTEAAAGGTGIAQVQTNAGFNIAETAQQGQTYLQFAQSVVEAGDTTQKWVLGITTPDFNTGQRYVYYKPATTTVKYTVRALSDSGKVFDLYGRTVDPWRVQPDNGIRVTDVLVGHNLSGDDPTLSYIDTIEYDAEAQSVSWQSGDDITLEGVLQQRKYFKRHGKQLLGANIRPLV